jgi:hypothetical protein
VDLFQESLPLGCGDLYVCAERSVVHSFSRPAELLSPHTHFPTGASQVPPRPCSAGTLCSRGSDSGSGNVSLPYTSQQAGHWPLATNPSAHTSVTASPGFGMCCSLWLVSGVLCDQRVSLGLWLCAGRGSVCKSVSWSLGLCSVVVSSDVLSAVGGVHTRASLPCSWGSDSRVMRGRVDVVGVRAGNVTPGVRTWCGGGEEAERRLQTPSGPPPYLGGVSEV